MLIKNKNLLFVVTAVIFIVYTLGVIHVTLRIGFDVLHVEPQWVDVLVVVAFLLATAVPVYAIVSLAVLEHFNRCGTTSLPVKESGSSDGAWINHFLTDEERREFIRKQISQQLGLDLKEVSLLDERPFTDAIHRMEQDNVKE